jgi:vanillin dehydrogenase
MFDIKLLIGDRDSDASDARVFERHNPMSGKLATRAAAATVADAQAAATAAAAAFPAWSALAPGERRAKLMRAADVLETRTEDFISTMAAETGATAGWAKHNVRLAANMLREAAAMTTHITGEVIPSDEGVLALAVRQPAGVVLGIAPWNGPVILGVRSIAMALACGNTVILKASEICPATHRLIGEVMLEAGLAPGVVNVLTNAPADASKIVDALISYPAVRRVNFTGSTGVGRIIGQTAARHLKPALLELGGKAPFLVLDDADLDEAVKAAAFSSFVNQGQFCVSTERIVVDASIADAFVAKLKQKAMTMTAGDPRLGDFALGSIVSREATERIESLVKDAVAKGATLIAGGRINGTIMEATVLDHVTSAMRIYGEETFGPVVCVVRARGVDEAVRIANDTDYGLSAAVHGRDVTRALAVAKRIESGMCHINGPSAQDEPQMPFGGVKGSGYGRFGGKASVAEFTELRWITISSGPGHYPI